eukprot:1149616-Pelagomonas_calceolata.AAC.2
MLSYIPTWVDISMLSLQTKRKSQICIMTSYPHILNSSRFDEKRRSCCLQTNRAGARLLDLASNYKLIITTDRIGKDRVASGQHTSRPDHFKFPPSNELFLPHYYHLSSGYGTLRFRLFLMLLIGLPRTSRECTFPEGKEESSTGSGGIIAAPDPRKLRLSAASAALQPSQEISDDHDGPKIPMIALAFDGTPVRELVKFCCIVVIQSKFCELSSWARSGKEKKNYVGRGNSPYIKSGKGDTLAQKSRESPPRPGLVTDLCVFAQPCESWLLVSPAIDQTEIRAVGFDEDFSSLLVREAFLNARSWKRKRKRKNCVGSENTPSGM